MTARQETLFNAAYAATHEAADRLSSIADQDIRLEPAKVREVARLIREAGAALTTLESLLAGNPEPRRGD